MVLSFSLLFCTFACVSFGNVITPVQPEVSGTEGDSITLSCSYSSAITLQWYRQYSNSAPEFLLIIMHSSGKVSQKSKIVEQDPRFSGKYSLSGQEEEFSIDTIQHAAVTPLTFAGSRASEVITPKRDREFALEGDSVTLSCNYSGSARAVHWYRQYAGSPSQFLILEGSGATIQANPPVPGITINHRKTELHVDLSISSVKVTDSALYFCALRPTVTGNTTTLYKNNFLMFIKT
ncbi:uncharacterized protein LOC132096994 [Carassius carassius]|uniref:uncharacterized protein LOC132096994 n=1 Tax=Carassius carassius TaxID=217509 RepID=UPI0028685D30|nr:uncharacterized protein LOC132096994 [Carassius carassius]